VRDVILENIKSLRPRTSQPGRHDLGHRRAELGYSVSHLRAVFARRLGVEPGPLHARNRACRRPAQLLQRSEFNVSEIGERCGFESLYAFSRAFRKAYGIPPRTYRQLVSEGGQLPVSGRNG